MRLGRTPASSFSARGKPTPGKHEIEPRESGTPVTARARAEPPPREPRRRRAHPGWREAGGGRREAPPPCWAPGWRGRSAPSTRGGPRCSPERARGGAPRYPPHPVWPRLVLASTQLLRPGGRGSPREQGRGAPRRTYPFVRGRSWLCGSGRGVTRSPASKTGSFCWGSGFTRLQLASLSHCAFEWVG